jgi:hypothetical protein
MELYVGLYWYETEIELPKKIGGTEDSSPPKKKYVEHIIKYFSLRIIVFI